MTESFKHRAMIRCRCGGAGMVRGEVTGTPEQTVTVTSHGKCGDGHELAVTKSIKLPKES